LKVGRGVFLGGQAAGGQANAADIGDLAGSDSGKADVAVGADTGGGAVYAFGDRIIGNDIDDAGGGIEAEQGCIRAFDDLDLTDFLQFDRQGVPLRATKIIEIYLLAVEQYEQARITRLIVTTN